MKESPEITEAKRLWVEEYFTKHPGHSADRCNVLLRKRFVHGLNWTTVQNIRSKVTKDPVITKVRGKIKLKVNGSQYKLAAIPVQQTDDPVVTFKVALADFRTKIKALPGVTLRSLTIKLDDETGKWDIAYDLANTERQVSL